MPIVKCQALNAFRISVEILRMKCRTENMENGIFIKNKNKNDNWGERHTIVRIHRLFVRRYVKYITPVFQNNYYKVPALALQLKLYVYRLYVRKI